MNLKRIGNLEPRVNSWQVYSEFKVYKSESRKCSLHLPEKGVVAKGVLLNIWLKEKLEMLDDKENNLLNKSSEIFSRCSDQNKYMLCTQTSKHSYRDIT